MSISHTLSNALTGLTASARMAEVVSSNLSNVLTDGYGRRVVNLSAQQVGGRGAGVLVDGITRIVDRGLLAERRLAEANAGYNAALANGLGSLEALIGAPDDASGLAGRVASLELALGSAAADPSNNLNLEQVFYRLQDLALTLNDAQSGIQSARQQADADIATEVDALNNALQRVEQLNGDIAKSRTQGMDPSALIDQRQAILDQISGIVPIRVMDRGNDRVAVMTESGAMLLDGNAVEIGFSTATAVAPGWTFANGMLSGLTLNGEPASLTDGVGRLSGGSLGAAFEMRDEVLPEAQAELDAIARDLIERFADPTVDPSLAVGDPGLLTDSGAAIDPLNELGIAGRISVNALVDPNAGGDLWRIRDGVGAGAAGPVGDATQLDRWVAGLSMQTVLSTGGAGATASGHAISYASGISIDRVRADESAAYASARWSAVREAELANGVDSDQEMQLLLQIETAYAANARVVEVADAMLRRLMEI